MAGTHAGARLWRFAVKARGGPRIHHLRRTILQCCGHAAEIGHGGGIERRLEGRAGGGRNLGRHRTVLGHPAGQPAFEDADILRAVEVEHPRDARRREQPELVVDDDGVALGDPELAHGLRKERCRRQHVRQVGVAVGNLVEVEIDRAGDVRGRKFCRAVAACGRQVPGPVDNPHLGVMQVLAEPGGGHEGDGAEDRGHAGHSLGWGRGPGNIRRRQSARGGSACPSFRCW